MEINFTNKHVAVTGGTGALGSATAITLLENGAKVSIPCFNKGELKNIDFKDHKNVFIQIGIDLTNEYSSHNFYKSAVKQHGALWASVNIAGGFSMNKIENLTKADFTKQIDMNLITCFNACRAAILNMGSGGRIVNIAARPALEPRQGAGMSAYAVSKAGVAALTQSLAEEVIEKDILINAVAPSAIDTPQNRKAMPNADYNLWLNPKDIAAQILYLISEKNKITSGAVIPVYGKS